MVKALALNHLQMRKAFLILIVIPLYSYSHDIMSVQHGNFTDTNTWDCSCYPEVDDNLYIGHDVVFDTNFHYIGAQLTINFLGSLIEDGTHRYLDLEAVSFVNSGELSIHFLHVYNFSSIINTGDYSGVDSLWNEATISNNGQMTILDLINDESATFINTDEMNVTNLFNEGAFTSSGTISVLNNFSNCNTQVLDAKFINDGIVCVSNDLINCAGDSLIGTGNYFVGGTSINSGVLGGTPTFHTPSGTLDVPGTIEPGVIVTTGSCILGVSIDKTIGIKAYPNPTRGMVYLEGEFEDLNQIQVFNLLGKEITSTINTKTTSNESLQINLSSIPPGIYLIKTKYEVFRIIKE